MIDPNNICMGCMKEKEGDGRCPFCGFSLEEYNQKRSPRVLPPYTILNGKYLLGRVLGQGGFGITYLALDLNLQIPLAIKEYFPTGLVIRDNMNGNRDTVTLAAGDKGELYAHGLESFTKEAQNLARFHGREGIVSVTNFFFENGTGYLVMDYIQGRSLKEYLKEKGGAFSQKETLSLMRPVLKALSEVHKAGIVHRDISPDNIMLSNTGKTCLIDFGAARNATGTVVKTLTVQLKHGYAPVEQYQTKGKQGPWTDIYAVCATMYTMMSGEKPEASTDRVQKDRLPSLEQLAAQNPNLHISPGVSRAIQKGMEVRMENRYQNIEDLMADLYATEGRREVKPEKKPKANVGTILTWAAFGLFGLFLIVAGGSLLVSHFRDKPQETKTEKQKEAEEPIQELHLGKGENDKEQKAYLYQDKDLSAMESVPAVMASITSTDQLDGTVENSPILMFDGDVNTILREVIPGDEKEGQMVTASLGEEYPVKYLSFRLGNWKNATAFHDYNRPKTLKIFIGDKEFQVSFPEYEYGQEYCLELDPPIIGSSVSVQTKEVYRGRSRGENCMTDIFIYREEAHD